MGVIKPIVESHEKLVEEVRAFLEGKSGNMPNLGSGRFDRQAYKYALAVDTLMENVESLIGELKKKAEEKGTPVTCSAGCSECCSQPVGINFPEVFYIAEYMNQNPEVKERFLKKYPAWRKKIDPARYDRIIQSMMTGGPNEGGVNSAIRSFYKEGAIPCPFLENRLCDVYPVRPIVCRQQMTTSNPEDCRADKLVNKPVLYDFQMFMLEKVSPAMINIMENLGLINTVTFTNFPITVKEFLEYGQKYVDHYVKTAKMLLQNP